MTAPASSGRCVRRSHFSQRDLTKAIRAARAAGEVPRAATISPDGEIRLELGPSDCPAGSRNDFDQDHRK
jgi:hypothetical protein